jgi:membrane-associated phospholipid phosphatase
MIAAECPRNCAFVSGHAALGFSLVAFAFLVPPGLARRAILAAALAIGVVIGLGRIAQGAHFLSDVVYAGLLAYGTTALLYWWIVERDALAAPGLVRLCARSKRGVVAGWRIGRRVTRVPAVRVFLVTIVAIVLIAISIGFVDRPLTLFLHARDPDLRALFDLTGRLGLTYGYLSVFGLAFVALHWGGLLARLQPFARPMRAFSAIPAFLFLSIAASGVVVDILKFLFGRPRPKLLFGNEIYDFGGLGLHADSGHSATIVALMSALWFVWPQHLLFYVLVAAIVSLSRVVVSAHYLSDVFAGALIAVLTTWGMAAIFARSGIDLSAARQGKSKNVPSWPCRRFGRAQIPRHRTESPETGSVACADREECNIGPRAERGSRIGSASWPYASRPSTIPVVETPSTRR